MPRVLVADDQPAILEALGMLLRSEGYTLELARSPAGLMAALDANEFDAALIDLNYARDTTSGAEGLDALARIHALEPTLSVIVMTAWSSVGLAVESMRQGAYDYVEKPWDNARLLSTLTRGITLTAALRAGRRLEQEVDVLRGAPGQLELISNSPRMRQVLRLIERVAPSDANVLITGEHGTGKEVVAQYLHNASPRARKPFVAVNLGGLSEGLFESEMFGHVRGAFTDARSDRVGRFELADGGSLFLDELANITLPQQARLLRTLQTREVERVGSARAKRVDVRIISATNAVVHDEVSAGRFREDLLFRLNTIEITLPPLRDRRADITPLATAFLERQASKYGRRGLAFDTDAVTAMLGHRWPGNVRELEHAVERGVLMSQGTTVRAADLGLRPSAQPAKLEEMTLEEAERAIITRTLSRFEGNVSQAAQALGLSRSALYRRLGAQSD